MKYLRPSWFTDAMLSYLDDLRKSGSINMWLAAPLLEEHFRLSNGAGSSAILYWLSSKGVI